MSLVRAGGLVIYRLKEDDPLSSVEFLLLQAIDRDHHWTPPKGHLDPGEDFMTAALRETEEEAGLKENQLEINDLDAWEVLYYQRKGRPKMVKYWLAKLKKFDDKVVLSHEHQNYKWFKLEDAKKIAPRHQHVLQNFYDYLNGKILYHYKYGKIQRVQ